MSESTQMTQPVTINIQTDILTAVIQAIETILDDDMENLPLVAEAVNIDAMCNLLEDDPNGTAEVHFTYETYDFTVTSDTVTAHA